ncbi:hypothetical protein [Dysgonomonas macrotermitis]|uniref:DUF4142 domain-containing protein n=1 Tax=Dysgonomonas macrotermitis TaxID=1346286 RepID=A0A1M5FPX7_9BACT|nr:hypothetical protein [Dysgonomonas macrotermitis]SHF93479.1 hypothetical protein SAMN05444362_11271 [Dysgonomonas macrotermitis]
MKRQILSLMLFLSISGVTTMFAQTSSELPVKVAEITKMVKLDNEQQSKLLFFNYMFEQRMDSAIYQIENIDEASDLIFKAKRNFNDSFMMLLSDKQKAEYIRHSSFSEITMKTEAKIKILRKSGDYNDSDLEQAHKEIFEYFMLEKFVYVNDRYNIERQKENIAQLKKLEPQTLKTANALQKAKHQGITYQNGYKW